MAPLAEEPNGGKATIREVRDLIDAHERADRERLDELKHWLLSQFSGLEDRYVLRAACNERHRYIDPRTLIVTGFLITVAIPLLTAWILAHL